MFSLQILRLIFDRPFFWESVLGFRLLELEVGRFFRIMVFVYASFLIGLAMLFCVFIHEIPDQVWDGGEVNLDLNKIFIVVWVLN